MRQRATGAAIALDFISRVETGREAPDRYEVIFGHNQDKLPKSITQMTLDEVEAAQASCSASGMRKSSRRRCRSG